VKISLIGNCQIAGLEKCIKTLKPGIPVETLGALSLTERFGSKSTLLDHLSNSSHVYFHDTDQEMLYGSSDDLRHDVPHAHELPFVTFNGFHPDMVYVTLNVNGNVQILKSPVGDNHSALVLFAHQQGLSARQALKLFCPSVYQRTGMTQVWENAMQSLRTQESRTSCPLTKLVIQWSRRGSFMHTLNHPKIFVLADLARWLLQDAKIDFTDVPVEDLVIDDLMTSTIWPVYLGLSDGLGVRGSFRFKKEMETSFLDLPEFIEQSFGIYARHPMQDITCWLTNLWNADEGIRSHMMSIVGESDSVIEKS
jgi:hypothetical protein